VKLYLLLSRLRVDPSESLELYPLLRLERRRGRRIVDPAEDWMHWSSQRLL